MYLLLCVCLFCAYLQISVEYLVPGESFLIKQSHEGVGVEFFHVPNTGLLPYTFKQQHRTNHGGYSGGIAYSLHAGFLEGCLM